MNMLRYWLIFGAVATAYGHQIQFLFSPEGGIHFPVTDQLVLRCSLTDSPSSDDRFGRRHSTRKNFLHSTRKNLSIVTSISVTKDGTPVASVSQYAPANAFTKQNNLQVTGKVSGLTSKDCYLEMIWAVPNNSQGGSYMCEIHALDEFFFSTVFTKVTLVPILNTTMKQIANYIWEDQIRFEELRDSMVETQRALQTMNSSLIQTQRELQTMNSILIQTQRPLPTMNSDLTQTQRRLQSMHTETGIETCDGRTLRKKGRSERTIKFRRPYDVVPKVTVGLSGITATNSRDTGLFVYVKNVTTTEFTYVCHNDTRLSRSHIYDAIVDYFITD